MYRKYNSYVDLGEILQVNLKRLYSQLKSH